jgi:hypothetical protein
MTKVTVQIKSPPPTGPSADVMIQVENADGDLCTYVPEHVYDNVVLQLKEKLRKHVAALYDVDDVLKNLAGLEPLRRPPFADD